MNGWHRTLRGRLLGLLGAAIVATVAVQGIVAFRIALAEAHALFDLQMRQTAAALAAELPPGDAPHPPAPRRDIDDDLVVQVWDARGVPRYRSLGAGAPPAVDASGFSDLEIGGTRWRIWAETHAAQRVQVAQEVATREHFARRLALRAIAPLLLAAPALMLLAWWAVRSSLAPLARVRDELAARNPRELAPLAAHAVPEEVRPLIDGMNALLHQVRDALQAQQRFVADAAHELRSPLSALKVQVQGLRRAPDASVRVRAEARLEAGIDRAVHLVGQLLSLARQQARLQHPEPEATLALADVVRDELAEAAPAAQARGVDLGMERADDATVVGHADALRVLVRNLLDNAIRHARDGGAVDVSVVDGEVDRGPRLVVEDDGPGIAPALRESAFDRFHRLEPAAGPGSGLGLAIVRSIAELHGARVRLDRSAARGGLLVEVAFPPADQPRGTM